MNELGLAIALSLWIATLIILAVWVIFWKTRKKKRTNSESEEEFLSEEISQIDDEPVFSTKVSSIQPSYRPYPIIYEVRNRRFITVIQAIGYLLNDSTVQYSNLVN